MHARTQAVAVPACTHTGSSSACMHTQAVAVEKEWAVDRERLTSGPGVENTRGTLSKDSTGDSVSISTAVSGRISESQS